MSAVIIRMPQQTGLMMIIEFIPGHGDIVGTAFDIDQAIVGIGKITMIDPDMMGRFLNIDRIIRTVLKKQIADNDIGLTVNMKSAAVNDALVADADNGFVGIDCHHRGQFNGIRNLNNQRVGIPGIIHKISCIGYRNDIASFTAAGAIQA